MNSKDVKNYEDAVSYCLTIPRFTGKNSIDVTRDFYEYLGRPGSASRIVHVAGTNGKGSVCAFLQSVCMEMNNKVGMFTSPHLCDIRERIRMDGSLIAKEDFLRIFCILAQKTESFCQEEKTQYHPSFFEWLFFMAMLYFEENTPDIILLETGLGGRLDATNCIKSPALTIITKIGMDHMEYLGETLKEIAAEKAGILKAGVPLIYLQDKKEADDVILQKAKILSCPCTFVSKEQVDSIFFHDKHIDFSYKSRYYGYVRFSLNTTAFYQMENAVLSIAAAEELYRDSLDEKILQKGILAMHWEGRMEEVFPGVFLDGAHNEDGIEAFLVSVSRDGCIGKRSLLFSAVSDKRYAQMAKMITDSGLFSEIYTAPIDSARGIKTEELEQLFESSIRKESRSTPHTNAEEDRLCIVHTGDSKEALQEMLGNRGTEDYLYVAGSLYLIGQLKQWFKELAND